MTSPHPNTKPVTGQQRLYARRYGDLHKRLRNWLKKTGQLK
jgi:hypothetical protein